jgi:hypothetical protein
VSGTSCRPASRVFGLPLLASELFAGCALTGVQGEPSLRFSLLTMASAAVTATMDSVGCAHSQDIESTPVPASSTRPHRLWPRVSRAALANHLQDVFVTGFVLACAADRSSAAVDGSGSSAGGCSSARSARGPGTGSEDGGQDSHEGPVHLGARVSAASVGTGAAGSC